MVTPASNSSFIRNPNSGSSLPTHPLTSLALFCLKQVHAAFSFCYEKILLLSRSISKLSEFFKASFIVTAYKCRSAFQGDQRPIDQKVLEEGNSTVRASLETLGIVKIPTKEQMLEAIRNGADIDAADEHGKTLAHTAASYGYLSVLQELTERGANLNALDRYGNTPASDAARMGKLEVLEFLHNQGVDLKTVREIAHKVMLSPKRVELLQYLEWRGVDLSAVDREGSTLAHIAVYLGDLNALRFLKEKEVDLSRVDREGNTLAHIAAFLGDLNALRFLKEKEVDLQAKNTGDKQPIDLAREISDEGLKQEIVDFLESTTAES